jgi:hypothetical protein
MTPPAADPTFAILAGVGEAVQETRYLLDAIRGWEAPADLDVRAVSLYNRLRAIESLGLEIRVNVNQEVLL